jgi:HAD superfamily hydrolase (TIGR01509 family)
MAYPLIIFDLGDTLMSEETEQEDGDGVTLAADLVPGMADIVRELRAAGVRLGLVADTRSGTYRHVLRQHDLDDLFVYVAISEELGIAKPHPEMFLSVVRMAGGTPADTLMVGNNYARDIDGAHACGLATVWFRWNDRYPAPRLPRAATYVATAIDEVNTAIDLWLRSHAFR